MEMGRGSGHNHLFKGLANLLLGEEERKQKRKKKVKESRNKNRESTKKGSKLRWKTKGLPVWFFMPLAIKEKD